MHIRVLLSLLLLLFSYVGNACNVTITTTTPAICVGQQVMIVANGAVNYTWAPTVSTNDTIWVSPTVTTTYTVIGTGPANCNDTATITITVTQYPNVTVTAALDTVCAGVSNPMTATGASQYQWYPGNHTGASYNPLPNSTTTYTIIGTNNPGGCKDTVYKTIYVKAAAVPILTDSNLFSPFNNCSNTSGLPTYTLNVTTANNPSVSSYSVNWGDGSPILTSLTYANFVPYLSKTYGAFGVFNLTFTANYANGCSRDTVYKVINQTNPSVGCTGPGNTQGCAPVQYCFKLTGYQQNSPGTIYVWNFGDGTSVTWTSVTVDSICHTFNQSSCNQPGGQYTVSVKAINSCDSTTATVNNVRVAKKPTANFTLPDTTFCVNTAVQATNMSTPASNIGGGPNGCNFNTLYSWNFGDPLGANNTSNLFNPPAHFYANPGTYTITLIASGNCGPDTMKKVVCIENNVVNFSLSNVSLCAPAQVNLTNTSNSTDCISTPYTWSITQQNAGCIVDSVNNFVFVSGNTSSNAPVVRFNNQGTYRIRLSHTNKCGTIFKDTLITIKRKPKITISEPATICFGNAITPTVSVDSCAAVVGTGTWSFPAATPNTSNSLTPSFTAPVGTHVFTYSISNQCGTSTQADTIQVLPQPSVAITSSAGSAICAGQSTTLTASGASTYFWSIGSSNATISVSPTITTTYTVTGTSAQGCTKTATITITVNPLPSITLAVTPPTCQPNGNGIITVNASNGTPAYSYQLNANPFQPSNIFSNLTPNVYTITVIDANNCTKSSVQNVATPNSPVINSVTKVNVSCNGGANASMQVNASGGTGSLTYVLNPGNISNNNGTYSNLSANVYTVTVTDMSGCTSITTVSITQPPVLTLNLVADSVLCFGQSSGKITATVAGGTASYFFQLQPGGTTNTTGIFNNLSVGTYTVQVTDSKGCTKTATATIFQPAVLSWSITSTQAVLCNNGNTGSITVGIGGGVPSYTFTRSPGNVTNTSGVFNNLSAGNYVITATDVNGCTKSTTLTVNQPTVLSITGISNTPPTCSPGGDATLSFNGTGGIPSYSYAVSPNYTFLTTNTFGNLSVGTYTIQVKDANQCTASAVYTINLPNAPQIQNVAITNTTCNGGNNGALTISANGGTGSLQYSVQQPPVYSINNQFLNLGNGTYTITVKDSVGCSSSTTASIITPSGPVINSIIKVNATCNPGCNGTIQVNASSAFALQYRLNNLPYQNGSSFTSVCAGTYTITVKDTNQCTASTTVVINTNNTLVLVSDSIKQVTCFGANNGKIYLSATGGALPVNYTLQPGNITNTNGDFLNLSPAIYTITAIDAAGCSQATTVQITQPTLLSITNVSSINVSCNGGNNGSIAVAASGGTGTKTYTRQPGNQSNTTGSFTNLVAGTYTITVRDANLCSVTSTVVITQPSPLLINSVSNTQPACIPANSATLSITASGGVASYLYSIGGAFQASSVFNNLTPSTYTISVSDANNCSVTSTWIIAVPNAPQITNVSVNPVLCFGQSNGSFTVTANGGTGALNYTAQPNNLSNTNGQFSSLLAGTYTVTVTDQLGCTSGTQAIINQPTNLFFVSATTGTALCNNSNTGSVSAVVNGGVMPYSFTLQPNNTTNSTGNFTNLTSGVYTIVVSDANGCSKTTTVSVGQPNALNFNTATITAVSCFGGNNGTLVRTATGGSGLISYTLNPGGLNNNNGTFNSLSAGIYTLTATDANGCSISATHTIVQPTLLKIDSIINSAPSCAPMSISVLVSGGIPSYTYAINGGGSGPSNVFTNLGPGTYTISVVDANGCVKTATKTLVLPNQPQINSVSVTSPTCFGFSNGAITSIVPAGGASPYVLSVSPGNSFNNLTAGTYTVMATDANSCSVTSVVTISQPAPISLLSSISNQVLCHNQTNGSLQFIGTGGTGLLTYTLINSGSSNTTGQFNNLAGGNYTVQITDANSCTFTTTQSVVNPPAIVFTSVSYTPITCNGLNNGSFVTQSGGGTGLLTYSIFPSVIPSNTTGIFNPLAANNYTVTVSDINGCTKDTAITVLQPPPVTGTFLVQSQVSCFGGQNGQFTVFANSGYAPFQFYLLGSPAVNSTGVFSNLQAGTYSVQLVDSAFCTTTIGPIQITQPTPIVWDSIYIPHIRCYGNLTDSLRVKASGGVGNFSYSITPLGPQTNALGRFNNLTAQVYTITAIDANGCSATTTVTITQNNAIVFPVFNIQYPACFGDSNGRIEVYASGGVPPLYYQFNGSTPSLNSVYNNLKAGSYNIRITDALNCFRDTTILLTQLNQLQLTTLNVGPEICIEGNDATIYVQATGGIGNLVYGLLPDSISNSTGLFTPLSAGTYTLLISDTAGCSLDTLVTVTPTLNPLDISITKNNLGCLGVGTEGYAIADVSGGAQPYTYLWNTNPPQTTPKASDLRFGYYIVQVSDVKGCTISDTVYIEPGTCCEEVFIPSAFTPNGDGLNDVFRCITAAGLQVIQFEVFNRWGERVWSTDDYTKGWDGTHKGQIVGPNEVFYYTFVYRCLSDGKTYSRKGDVTVIR